MNTNPVMDLSVSTTPANATLNTSFMGHTKLMVGYSGDSSAGDSAPFDMQYQYFNSAIFSSYDHAGCVAGTVPLKSCSGWIAWQEDVPTRGLFATRFIGTAKARTWNSVSRPQIPFFTYYMMLPASGLNEGVAETYALDDQTFLTTYFNDWRFLLQKIGNEQAMLHIEPDLFGYLKARAGAGQPSDISAKVTASNPTDCTGYADNATGFSKCMIHMVRVYAPNATVGLHFSPWTYTSASDITSWSSFMIAMGADQGDFLVADSSDRDADWYRLVQGQPGHDWDVAKMTAFLQWTKGVSTAVGKPFFLWQLPLGNSYQNNTTNHYKDQRVELLFSHIGECVMPMWRACCSAAAKLNKPMWGRMAGCWLARPGSTTSVVGATSESSMFHKERPCYLVIPAKAGIQRSYPKSSWVLPRDKEAGSPELTPMKA